MYIRRESQLGCGRSSSGKNKLYYPIWALINKYNWCRWSCLLGCFDLREKYIKPSVASRDGENVEQSHDCPLSVSVTYINCGFSKKGHFRRHWSTMLSTAPWNSDNLKDMFLKRILFLWASMGKGQMAECKPKITVLRNKYSTWTKT